MGPQGSGHDRAAKPRFFCRRSSEQGIVRATTARDASSERKPEIDGALGIGIGARRSVETRSLPGETTPGARFLHATAVGYDRRSIALPPASRAAVKAFRSFNQRFVASALRSQSMREPRIRDHCAQMGAEHQHRRSDVEIELASLLMMGEDQHACRPRHR